MTDLRRYAAVPTTLMLAAGAAAVVSAGPARAAGPEMVVVAFEDAKFVPVDPKLPDGAAIAVLWGDPAGGPSAMLLKQKKGSSALHLHTADYDLVMVQGTMKHWAQGQQEAEARPLGPGSYWHQPGGQAHAGSCLTEECVMFVKWAGPRDGMLAAQAR